MFQAGRISEERQYCYAAGRCTQVGGGGGAAGSPAPALTQWSPCSAQCGGGQQWRLGGTALLTQPCNPQPCPGQWGCWAEWSDCGGRGSRQRERPCLGGECGAGRGREEEQCTPGLQPRVESTSHNTNILVGVFVLGFLLGSGLGAALLYYYFRIKQPGGVTAPNYISAKSQNLYVSLPMLDLNKHKQLGSPASDYTTVGSLRSNAGTLRSKAASSTGWV